MGRLGDVRVSDLVDALDFPSSLVSRLLRSGSVGWSTHQLYSDLLSSVSQRSGWVWSGWAETGGKVRAAQLGYDPDRGGRGKAALKVVSSEDVLVDDPVFRVEYVSLADTVPMVPWVVGCVRGWCPLPGRVAASLVGSAGSGSRVVWSWPRSKPLGRVTREVDPSHTFLGSAPAPWGLVLDPLGLSIMLRFRFGDGRGVDIGFVDRLLTLVASVDMDWSYRDLVPWVSELVEGLSVGFPTVDWWNRLPSAPLCAVAAVSDPACRVLADKYGVDSEMLRAVCLDMVRSGDLGSLRLESAVALVV